MRWSQPDHHRLVSGGLGLRWGRALGARLTTSDTVLFLDGDLPIRAERLVPFLHAVERGADLALNDLSPYIGRFAEQDHVTNLRPSSIACWAGGISR